MEKIRPRARQDYKPVRIIFLVCLMHERLCKQEVRSSLILERGITKDSELKRTTAANSWKRHFTQENVRRTLQAETASTFLYN